MKINKNTILDYLEGRAQRDWSNQWIFHSIEEGKYLIETVPEEKKEKIKETVLLLEQEVANFQPFNKEIWDELFPKGKDIVGESTVYFIVGSPEPYDAMVLTSPEGEEVIIFDINVIMKYVDSIEKLVPIMRNLLTHECAHKCIHKDHEPPNEQASFLEKLKFLSFDEGFALFLSFNEDVKSVDWKGENFKDRRSNAYKVLKEAIKANVNEQEAYLKKAGVGGYWEKYGAVAGLFTIADAYEESNYRNSSILQIYENGPENFLEKTLGTVERRRK